MAWLNPNHGNDVVLIQIGRTRWKSSRLVLRKMTFRLALTASYIFSFNADTAFLYNIRIDELLFLLTGSNHSI